MPAGFFFSLLFLFLLYQAGQKIDCETRNPSQCLRAAMGTRIKFQVPHGSVPEKEYHSRRQFAFSRNNITDDKDENQYTA